MWGALTSGGTLHLFFCHSDKIIEQHRTVFLRPNDHICIIQLTGNINLNITVNKINNVVFSFMRQFLTDMICRCLQNLVRVICRAHLVGVYV